MRAWGCHILGVVAGVYRADVLPDPQQLLKHLGFEFRGIPWLPDEKNYTDLVLSDSAYLRQNLRGNPILRKLICILLSSLEILDVVFFSSRCYFFSANTN